MTQQDLFKKITNRILENLAKGLIPWERPWSGVSNQEYGAISYVSRKPYSFLNQMLLDKPGEYLSFKQIKELNGHVKKNEKASIIVFYKPLLINEENAETGEKTQRIIPYLKNLYVFHIDQTEGIESKAKTAPPHETATSIQNAENIITDYINSKDHPAFYNQSPSNRAFYNHTNDSVTVPMLSQYEAGKSAFYYSTVFHEFCHSTGKASRLNRDFSGRKGNSAYAYEELVAEIGAAMLCSHAGIDSPSTFKNTTAYIQSWIKVLKNDERLFITAASKAEKAALYILGKYQAIPSPDQKKTPLQA